MLTLGLCSVLAHFDLRNVFNISTFGPRECIQYTYILTSGMRSILVHFDSGNAINISTF